jgi:hypothetical protein
MDLGSHGRALSFRAFVFSREDGGNGEDNDSLRSREANHCCTWAYWAAYATPRDLTFTIQFQLTRLPIRPSALQIPTKRPLIRRSMLKPQFDRRSFHQHQECDTVYRYKYIIILYGYTHMHIQIYHYSFHCITLTDPK